MSRNIHFFAEDVAQPLKPLAPYRAWLGALAQAYGRRVSNLNYVFCSDEYLYQINVEHLQHDDYTDIITFDLSETPGEGPIEGDIFISTERVAENAADLGQPLERELRRVLAHGLLHICGLRDKSPEEATAMRQAEEQALTLWHTLATIPKTE